MDTEELKYSLLHDRSLSRETGSKAGHVVSSTTCQGKWPKGHYDTLKEDVELPKHAHIRKVIVIGSGPIVIGQAAEFDYAGTQACRALKRKVSKLFW